jgi:hypothetical protein
MEHLGLGEASHRPARRPTPSAPAVASEAMTAAVLPREVLALQRSAGNHAVGRLLSGTGAAQARPAAAHVSRAAAVQRDMIGTTAVGSPVSSREAAVYLTERWAYKAFANQETADANRQAWHDAEVEGVPVPEWKYYQSTLQVGGGALTTVHVLRSRRVSGRFFQVSKGNAFRGAVREVESQDTMKRLLLCLQAARRFGLTDPQGFLTAQGRVVFIDIHGGGTGIAVDTLIEAAQAHAEQPQQPQQSSAAAAS